MKNIDSDWLTMCAQAGEFLYGVFPVEILKKLYETKKGLSVPSIDKLVNETVNSPSIMLDYCPDSLPVFEELGFKSPGYFFPYVPDKKEQKDLYEMFSEADKKGNPYAEIHLSEKEWKGLLKEQEDVEFYIPNSDEIEALVTSGAIGCPEQDDYLKKLKSNGGDPDFMISMWQKISTDALEGTEAVNHLIQPIAKDLPSFDDINNLLPTIIEFTNSVNLRVRRGWAPTKLREKLGPMEMPTTIVPGSTKAAKTMAGMQPFFNQMGVNLDLSGAGQYTRYGLYGEKRNVKIYPNDPCPCGSGKKYKKCCGRNGGVKEVHDMII